MAKFKFNKRQLALAIEIQSGIAEFVSLEEGVVTYKLLRKTHTFPGNSASWVAGRDILVQDRELEGAYSLSFDLYEHVSNLTDSEGFSEVVEGDRAVTFIIKHDNYI